MKTLSPYKRNMPPIYSPPILRGSGAATSEHHPLLVMQNDDGDRAEFTVTPSIDDSVDSQPVIVLGNGEYRRAIHADGVGALWREMLILAAIVAAVLVFLVATGGVV